MELMKSALSSTYLTHSRFAVMVGVEKMSKSTIISSYLSDCTYFTTNMVLRIKR